MNNSYFNIILGSESFSDILKIVALLYKKIYVKSILQCSFISPPFCSSVLKPCFDLSVGHLESLGEGGPFGGSEVLLSMEALLQLDDL